MNSEVMRSDVEEALVALAEEPEQDEVGRIGRGLVPRSLIHISMPDSVVPTSRAS